MGRIHIFRFIWLMLRRGKLRHSGRNFGSQRAQLLADMPGVSVPSEKHRRMHPVLRTIVGELSFVRVSLTPLGGHLTNADGSLCYVRLPKCASTALCKAVLQDRFPLLCSGNWSDEQVNALADVSLERTSASIKMGAMVFTVVRNPLARIVSVYREFFEQRRGPFLYEDYLMGILKANLSFRDFLKTVNVIPDPLKDQHFRPQHLMIAWYDRKNISVDIMKLEDPVSINTFLMARGLEFPTAHRGESYDYRQYYDGETLQIAEKIYRKDIVRFGYADALADLKFTVEQRGVRI